MVLNTVEIAADAGGSKNVLLTTKNVSIAFRVCDGEKTEFFSPEDYKPVELYDTIIAIQLIVANTRYCVILSVDYVGEIIYRGRQYFVSQSSRRNRTRAKLNLVYDRTTVYCSYIVINVVFISF